jgi:oxaloacetate decarboxylase gamma subunit
MSDIMWDGVNLMVMGMGSVFVFLALLVLGTTLMSRILMSLPSNEAEVTARPQTRNSDEDMAEVAAVAAAVKLVHQR